jgi:hypothetical protein
MNSYKTGGISKLFDIYYICIYICIYTYVDTYTCVYIYMVLVGSRQALYHLTPTSTPFLLYLSFWIESHVFA